MRGDCLACRHISECTATSLEHVKESYTCPLFAEVPEAVYLARLSMMALYGEDAAIQAMLDRPPEEEEGDGLEDEEEGDEDG